MNVKVHVIARLESKRVERKNTRLLRGRPLLTYALDAAKGARGVDEVYLNTESDELARIAEERGVRVFRREAWLAADDIVLDQTTYAFAKAHEADVIGMVNPVCPLTTGADVDEGLRRFLDGGFDTLLTVREEQLHAFMAGKALNVDPTRRIPMTQDLVPIQIVTWNFCFWKRAAFLANYEANGFGVFTGKIGFHALDKRKAVKISDESDFRIAEALLAQREEEER
jgi:N-acylneuraminate cytidylyltransferase/CMP-N,N'-diacetyllegionaminic acid synthase